MKIYPRSTEMRELLLAVEAIIGIVPKPQSHCECHAPEDPTADEVMQAILALKFFKVPGVDNALSAEFAVVNEAIVDAANTWVKNNPYEGRMFDYVEIGSWEYAVLHAGIGAVPVFKTMIGTPFEVRVSYYNEYSSRVQVFITHQTAQAWEAARWKKAGF